MMRSNPIKFIKGSVTTIWKEKPLMLIATVVLLIAVYCSCNAAGQTIGKAFYYFSH